jgi:hypothetical protein
MKVSGKPGVEFDIDCPVLDHRSSTSGVELESLGGAKPFISLDIGLIELGRYGVEPRPLRGTSIPRIINLLRPFYRTHIFGCRPITR